MDETTAMAPAERFATLGELVGSADVPALVRAGREVWSFGYGDDPDEFTTIEASDLWPWEDFPMNDAVIASWGPFRVSDEPDPLAEGEDYCYGCGYREGHEHGPVCDLAERYGWPRVADESE